MTSIDSNLQDVRGRIATACAQAGRPVDSVQLLAVSKTMGADAVIAAIASGQAAFGENYIQEGVEKIRVVREWEARGGGVFSEGETLGLAPPGSLHSDVVRSPLAGPLCPPSEWHCIGPIQSNKSRLVAAHFDWVHSVDRLKLAQRLSEQRPAELSPLQICLQVNIDGGANKSGVAPEDVEGLARQVAALPRLCLRGLMTIPEPVEGFPEQLGIHARAKDLFERIRASGAVDKAQFDTLSMGMTADLEAAIHAGSTLVRVGTAIFGKR